MVLRGEGKGCDSAHGCQGVTVPHPGASFAFCLPGFEQAQHRLGKKSWLALSSETFNLKKDS